LSQYGQSNEIGSRFGTVVACVVFNFSAFREATGGIIYIFGMLFFDSPELRSITSTYFFAIVGGVGSLGL